MSKIKCLTNDGGFIEIPKEEISFRPQVYAVVINDNNQVLLCPNWDGYDFPGGGMDIGESINQALEREVFEETGLQIKPGPVFFVDSSIYYHPLKKKAFHTILMYATAEVTGGKISVDKFDKHEKTYAGKAVWKTYNDAKNLKYYNSVDSLTLIDKAKQLTNGI